MQNIQHISGRSVAAYVCGYVASLDENLKVFLSAKAQQANQLVVSTKSCLIISCNPQNITMNVERV
jgi:hypothetical protein